MSINVNKDMLESVKEMVEYIVHQEKEKWIKNSVQEFETHLRSVVAKTTMEVSRFYSVETCGQNLVITVRIE